MKKNVSNKNYIIVKERIKSGVICRNDDSNLICVGRAALLNY